MSSMRMKWRGFGAAANAMLFLFAALDGGCVSRQCDPYGCVNAASLSGNVVIAKEVTVVDYRLCVGSTCKEGAIDLAQVDASTACSLWSLSRTKPELCLAKSNDSDTFALSAFSQQFPENEDPPDITFEVKLVDHVTGRALLEEMRIAKSRVTSNDDCHACWGAEATL
jgi:hypothetical protein